MHFDEAKARMREIQRIMETATLYTLLPGTAAIVGGVLVFGGCAVSGWLLQSVDFGQVAELSPHQRGALCLMWIVIAVTAVAVNARLTVSMARRRHIALNARPAQVATFALTPCVVVATVLSYQFLVVAGPSRPDGIRYIAPVWMMLYGTGVYTAGLFSVRPPRVLGLAFLAAGIVSLFWFSEYGVISVALSFGLFHVVFGAYVIGKQRQVPVPHAQPS
jgi:hypothetical protein